MAKIKIYENYGVLGEEGRSIYTYGGEAATAVISDELIVEIPDTWKLSENMFGMAMVTAPWGWDYDINEVLCGNKRPEFRAFNKEKKLKIFPLQIVTE